MPTLDPAYVANTKIRDALNVSEVNYSGIEFDLEQDGRCPCPLKEADQPRHRRKLGGDDQWSLRYYNVPWSALQAFEQWAVGGAYPTPTLGQAVGAPPDPPAEVAAWFNHVPPLVAFPALGLLSTLTRLRPMQDPQFPWMWAESCELVEPKGAVIDDPDNFATDPQGKVLTRDGKPVVPMCGAYVDNRPDGFADGVAVVKVTFRPRRYRVRDDRSNGLLGFGELGRHVEWFETPTTEAVVLAKLGTANLLTFVEGKSDTVQVPEPGIKLLPSAQVNLIWHEVPANPRSSWYGCLGLVNNANFGGCPGIPVYAPETLLFIQPQAEEGRSVFGNVTWTIRYRALLHPQGWNKYLDSKENPLKFNRATLGGAAGNNTPAFPSADFSQLFQIGYPANYKGG